METEAARARFTRAIRELATGTDGIQDRLSAAWAELLPLRKDDLPAALREAYEPMEAEMLAAPEDPATLSDAAAVASAERILRLAIELWRTP